jgi:hypothetical protein
VEGQYGVAVEEVGSLIALDLEKSVRGFMPSKFRGCVRAGLRLKRSSSSPSSVQMLHEPRGGLSNRDRVRPFSDRGLEQDR